MTKVSFTTKSGQKVSFTTKSKKSSGSKKSKKRHKSKTNKRTRSRSGSHMPRKKKGGKRKAGKKSFIDRIPILNNPTVQKIGFGLGMGLLVVQGINLASRFAPPAIAQPLQQNQRIIKLAVEAATEPISAIVDLVLPSIAGQPGNGTQTANQNMVGFA